MWVKKMLKSLIRQRWNIGFTENPIEDVVSGKTIEYKWLKHPYEGRWFADPFILDVTSDSYIVLVEDYEEKRGYADISRLIVDKRTMEITDIKTVLSIGSHLSFPFIIRKGEYIYILPENSVSGCLTQYRFDKDCDTFVKCKKIFDEPLTDAVPLEFQGELYLFATKLPSPNGNDLSIYKSVNGKFIMADSYIFDQRIARMAGAFFEVNGQLYRPAQDCNKSYGGAMWIQKALLADGVWSFENVRHLYSPHPDYQTGFHTFNSYKNVIVVDIHGYSKHPWLSSFLTNLINRVRTLR